MDDKAASSRQASARWSGCRQEQREFAIQAEFTALVKRLKSTRAGLFLQVRANQSADLHLCFHCKFCSRFARLSPTKRALGRLRTLMQVPLLIMAVRTGVGRLARASYPLWTRTREGCAALEATDAVRAARSLRLLGLKHAGLKH
jgi:hypothetical protein